MLIIKTKLTFIKKHKKTKSGKKIYKKKYFRSLYVNDIHMGMITSVSITRGCKPIEKTVFDENTPGWNQGIQDVFKKFPPIPIENYENKLSIEETVKLLADITNVTLEENLQWHPEENLQWSPYGLIKKYGEIRIHKDGEHKTLTSLTSRISKMTPEERIWEAKKWEADNFYPYIIPNLYQGTIDNLKNDNLPEGFEISFSEDVNKKLLKEHIEFLLNLNTDADITLDLDDVIYDLMKRNISFVEEVYGVKDVHLEITDYYYLYKTYPRIAEELWNHPENYISSELIEGAIEFYNELVDLVGGEDRIQIVTSSMENVIPLKNRMIKETFGFNCKVIHSIFGKYEKHIFTKNTFLIEDHVGNLKDHVKHNQCGGVIFNHMKLPYIEALCKQEGFEHVTTYKEVLESVKSYLSVKKCLRRLNFE